MVRAAGALLNFLDKYRIGGPDLDSRSSQASNSLVFAIRTFSPKDIVAIDETTLTALRIFKASSHLSGSKAGSWNQRKEGLSLFNTLNRCSSIAGSKRMRSLFRSLPRSVSRIQERQEAVVFFSHPSQIDLVRSMKECLKNIRNVPKVLKKLISNQASVKDWKTLKNTMNYIIALGELCQKQSHRQANLEIPLLTNLSSLVNSKLYTIKCIIDQVFDSELSEEKQRFTVNAGIDSMLDERKRFHNGLPDFLYGIAQEEITKLPDYMSLHHGLCTSDWIHIICTAMAT
jgi:DNA mismatch repair protein MSH5